MTVQAAPATVPSPKLGAAAGSAAARLRVPTGLGLAADDVDREKEILRNCIIAQVGPFKSEGRGEFDMQALTAIITLAAKNSLGIRCNYCHRDESHDGLGRHLGRFKDFRLGTVGAREIDGETVTDTVACVRADLHIDPTSHGTPEGDLGGYVLDLAKSDPQAISSSMVVETERKYRLNPDGTRQADADGNPLPPLWIPTRLMSADIVAVGDAVDGLLSHGLAVDTLPDAVLHRGVELLDKQFADKSRAFVEGHCLKFLQRYLDRRYGLAAAGNSLQAAIQDVLAVLRGQAWLYHTLHWQSAGENSYGQHLLFERLYASIPDQYDGLAEKSVALFGAASVEPVAAILSAAGHIGRWTGEPVAAGLSSEADLTATIGAALEQTAADPGLTNFLQGLADEHQTNVYLLQQVQGGKKPEEAMAAKPVHFAVAPKAERLRRLAKMLLEGLAAGDQPDDSEGGDNREGGPGIHDHADDLPEGSGEPQELHDGCRSTLAYHHQTLCRLCSGTIAACGCRNVAQESRVITMAKQPCAKCQAAGEDGEPTGGAAVPAGAKDQPEPDVEQARKRLASLLGPCPVSP